MSKGKCCFEENIKIGSIIAENAKILRLALTSRRSEIEIPTAIIAEFIIFINSLESLGIFISRTTCCTFSLQYIELEICLVNVISSVLQIPFVEFKNIINALTLLSNRKSTDCNNSLPVISKNRKSTDCNNSSPVVSKDTSKRKTTRGKHLKHDKEDKCEKKEKNSKICEKNCEKEFCLLVRNSFAAVLRIVASALLLGSDIVVDVFPELSNILFRLGTAASTVTSQLASLSPCECVPLEVSKALTSLASILVKLILIPDLANFFRGIAEVATNFSNCLQNTVSCADPTIRPIATSSGISDILDTLPTDTLSLSILAPFASVPTQVIILLRHVQLLTTAMEQFEAFWSTFALSNVA